MAINKNELSQEELSNVNGGYSEYSTGGNEYNGGSGNNIIIDIGTELCYSSIYPYYLDTYSSNIEGCAGFKCEACPASFACCAACDYARGPLCTLRAKDNDPYA